MQIGAVDVVMQLAEDERRDFPEAAEALKNDVFVDDLLTGAESVEEARAPQRQLICSWWI